MNHLIALLLKVIQSLYQFSFLLAKYILTLMLDQLTCCISRVKPWLNYHILLLTLLIIREKVRVIFCSYNFILPFCDKININTLIESVTDMNTMWANIMFTFERGKEILYCNFILFKNWSVITFTCCWEHRSTKLSLFCTFQRLFFCQSILSKHNLLICLFKFCR